MLGSETLSQPIKMRMSALRSRLDKRNLLIHEIYSSIQGESSHMGRPCVFVRTTGCHLRCSYCDTEHAFFAGNEMSIKEIVRDVASFKIGLVEVTGGEPLLQSATFCLLDELVALGYTVLLETSGAISIGKVNQRVKVILDVKTPSSLEVKKNLWHNLMILWPGCEVKFVIGSKEDYLFATEICGRYGLFDRSHVLFSPVVAVLDPKLLVEWILQDQLPVRFQLQLHRVLYGEARGR
ncbi:MAG TPA: radical SAM protein [Myxococcota bacterium]|nr:radical SAM protein [Myxococcota bacterium]